MHITVKTSYENDEGLSAGDRSCKSAKTTRKLFIKLIKKTKSLRADFITNLKTPLNDV